MNEAFVEKGHTVGYVTGERDFVGDQNHGHAVFGQQAHGIKYFAN